MMDSAHSAPSADDLELGEWFHQQIAKAFLVKRSEWVDGIAARLQSTRPATERLDVTVVWLSEMTAFTAPGRYIYVTGRLMEYCPGEASLAFTLAHEVAHHDLGHLQYFPRWVRDVADEELVRDAPFMTKLQIWVGQRARGYMPVRDRRRALEAYIAERGRGGTPA